MKKICEQIHAQFNFIDQIFIKYMSKYYLSFLRYSLALIFIWFGSLKFFSGLSPTVDLIEKATEVITLGLIPSWVAVYSLAFIECMIGVGLLLNIFMRLTLFGLFSQMVATSTPIFVLPEIVFSQIPYGLTMEGHHIIKNLILIGAGLALGAAIKNGKAIPQ